jgi:nitroreductase
MQTQLNSVTDLIRSRRTNLRIDRDRVVDAKTISSLIDLAVWAPNHRLTEPWRFAVISGEGRNRLGTITADFQHESGMTDPAKLDKTRSKFLRAPIILLVASQPSADAPHDMVAEDRDATAAATQNILLGATALGLASYWGSGAVCESPAVKAMAGFADHAQVIAAIYLGWPIGDVPVPERQAPLVSWVAS